MDELTEDLKDNIRYTHTVLTTRDTPYAYQRRILKNQQVIMKALIEISQRPH